MSFPTGADPLCILRAKWVAPIDGPVIEDGAVAYVQGHIVDVGPTRDILGRHQPSQVIDLGSALLTPGLVNAHVHLELSAKSQGDRPDGFVPWLKRLIPKPGSTPDPAALLDFVQRSIRRGVSDCLRHGVTTVGDISRHCMITRPLLRATPLRVVSYGEVQAMAQRRGLLQERLAIAGDVSQAGDRLRVGITPHAPYSVEPDGYRACLTMASERGLPLATHLAETPEEAEFLADHAGPFRDLWTFLDAWDDSVPRFAGGPIRLAAELVLLTHPTLLAHVNVCNDDELCLLAAGRASVAYCPRTHEYFGRGPHRWRDMLAAGVNVALGTDSCASSPDLDLMADVRLVHRMAPEVSPDVLWRLVTINAARAVRMDERVGSLSPGKAADFVAFAVEGNDPLREVIERDEAPVGVWIAGQRINATDDNQPSALSE